MKYKHLVLFVLLVVSSLASFCQNQDSTGYLNTRLTLHERVKDLLSKLNLDEKASLMGYKSKAVPRLGIPAYNWWNEGLHGVARAGEATIFPQAIGMAATFNPDLLQQAATVISTEARAKYNYTMATGKHLQYMGLSFWSPNINIFRDPRWGRGQETYGEDPYLTAEMGVAYIRGMQGNDRLHLKVSATAKHFVAHSGPEAGRDEFNSIADEKDLRETYLYAFHKLVNAGVESVMTAYNRINGEPNSISTSYLHNILMKEWGFKGHVVTDCGALDDVYERHKVLSTGAQVAAAAIKAGISLDCSTVLQDDIVNAITQKLLTEAEVDSALVRLLRTQFRLGFYDDKRKSPWYTYNSDSISNTAHMALARKMAQQSMVLLKNENHLLPLKKNAFSSLTVLGTNAASLDALIGSYHGVSSTTTNFVEGISKAVGPFTRVEYDLGCSYTDTTHFGGIWAAGNSDAVIAVIGLSPVLEGEAGDAFLSVSGGDKAGLSLPAGQIAFMRALRKGVVNKPIIAVITGGSDIDISAIASYADAIILAWYAGEQGGTALADILFGAVSPSGHLPLTFYRSASDLPEYSSYAMKGRTYRYFTGKVQYPFGYGLSYTSFDYHWKTSPGSVYHHRDTLKFSVIVHNTGAMDGDEVVQAYIRYPNLERMPLKELKGFKRLSIQKGDQQLARFQIPVAELEKWDLARHAFRLYEGEYTVMVGSDSAKPKLLTSFSILP